MTPTPGTPGTPEREALRDDIGQAIADKLAEWSEGGDVSFDPFDSRNIDEIADAVVDAIAARAPQAAAPQPTVQAEAVAVSEDAIERLRLEHCDRGILQKGAAHNFARAVLALSAPPVGEPVAQPKLIGWRTEDYLMETSDPLKARSWEAHCRVLPIFEGDRNTKLAAAPAGEKR